MTASGLLIAAGAVVAGLATFGVNIGGVNEVAAAIALGLGGFAVERLN